MRTKHARSQVQDRQETGKNRHGKGAAALNAGQSWACPGSGGKSEGGTGFGVQYGSPQRDPGQAEHRGTLTWQLAGGGQTAAPNTHKSD